MLAATDSRAVRAIFDTDIDTVHALHALLIEERAALTAREPETLDRVVQRKLECLQRMQHNDQARQQLLARHRGSDWATLLHTLDPQLDDSWQSLRTQLDEVADLGRTNERIIARMQHGTSHLLALLRGQDTTTSVYDRKGQTHPYPAQHGGTRV